MKQDLEKARASPIKSVITATPSVHFARECQKKDRRAKTGWQGKNQNQTEKL